MNFTFQASHEDEDEAIEEVAEVINDILGDHKHHYHSILQLVLADGVFSEGKRT